MTSYPPCGETLKMTASVWFLLNINILFFSYSISFFINTFWHIFFGLMGNLYIIVLIAMYHFYSYYGTINKVNLMRSIYSYIILYHSIRQVILAGFSNPLTNHIIYTVISSLLICQIHMCLGSTMSFIYVFIS